MGDGFSKADEPGVESAAISSETYWPGHGGFPCGLPHCEASPLAPDRYMSFSSPRKGQPPPPRLQQQDLANHHAVWPSGQLPQQNVLSSAVHPKAQQRAGDGARVARDGSGAHQPDSFIIWDWDDTLMCSSAINANQLSAMQIQQLEPLLEQVLVLSMRLGESIIITNADEMWVLESTRRYAPRVMPTLAQLRVVSARRMHERTYPGDIFAWKREAFREVISARESSRGALSQPLNLVVIGDSPAEIEAAQTSTVGVLSRPVRIKTIKFKEQPSCDELLEQLRLLVRDLGHMVAEERPFSRDLALERAFGKDAVAPAPAQFVNGPPAPLNGYVTQGPAAGAFLGVPGTVGHLGMVTRGASTPAAPMPIAKPSRAPSYSSGAPLRAPVVYGGRTRSI